MRIPEKVSQIVCDRHVFDLQPPTHLSALSTCSWATTDTQDWQCVTLLEPRYAFFPSPYFGAHIADFKTGKPLKNKARQIIAWRSTTHEIHATLVCDGVER